MKIEETEEKKTPITLFPEISEDIKLLRLIFNRLEFYTLKIFFFELRPFNIREIYSLTLEIIFNYIFSDSKKEDIFKILIKDLIGAGYGTTIISPQKKKEIHKKVLKEIVGKSETEKQRIYYRVLRENKIKTPSYEKFKRIFKKFEDMDIIRKISKEGKIIFYTLNPKFYKMFEKKREEIIKS